MIKRIVKMTFQGNKTEEFIQIFNASKEKIRNQPGCHHLELWRDTKSPQVFFTFSFWENEEALNAYRYSALFGEVWPKTKTLFADKPEAWSVDMLDLVT